MPQTFMQYPGYWLGTIMLAWCANSVFSSPYAPRYIKDRSDAQRYALGSIVFCFAAWIIYTVMWIIAWQIKAKFEIINAVAVVALVIVVIIIPQAPLLSRIVEKFRSFTHELTGFPSDAETLARNFVRPSPYKVQREVEADSSNIFLKQVTEVLSISCMNSFYEAIRIHKKIGEFISAINADSLNFSVPTYWPRYFKWKLRKYLMRRANILIDLENDYYSLLHRAGRVCKLVQERPLSERQLKQLSAFLADQAEEVIGRYEKLSSHIALSMFSTGPERKSFLAYLEYNTPNLAPALTLWPIAAVLAVELCTAALGFVLTTDFFHHPGAIRDAGVIVAQGFAMTTAALFSVAPKLTWDWARPAFARTAIGSNVLFGVATYVLAFAFFGIVLSGFNFSAPGSSQSRIPLLAMLSLPPGLFAVSNVILSWRIDIRILKPNEEDNYGVAAILDALWMLGGTILFTVFFRGTMMFVFGVAWKDLPNIWLIWTVLGVTALVIGYAIPGWASGYIYPVAASGSPVRPNGFYREVRNEI